MKILQIRFKNLNSLTGEWAIDFNHPAYTSDGIFAITGPTGAGKTTILDAICLALYGSTPRLGRITKSGNEIMSRQTGECFAEVTFETLQGRFRSHWSQHRSRRKADGELQAPKHELAEAATGKVLESKLREVAEAIEKATGMDFERFTRSMLLAQGSFAAFLSASPDERAPILEQITGTEIYSQISVRVHERRSEERRRLETLEAELSGMQLLGEAQEQTLRQQQEELGGQEAAQTAELAARRAALAWLDGVRALEQEVAGLETRWSVFQGRKDAFRPEWQRLQRARRAQALDGDAARLGALRDQQQKELREMEATREQLPRHAEARDRALTARQEALRQRDETRARQQSAAPRINQTRALDLRLAENRSRLEEASLAMAGLARQREEGLGRLGANAEARQRAQAALAASEAYLAAQSVDGALVENLAAIRRSFAELRNLEKQGLQLEKARAAADQEQERARQLAAVKAADRDRLAATCAEREKELGRLAEAMQQRLQGRETRDWRQELATLQERRQLLELAAQSCERIEGAQKTLATLDTRRTALLAQQAQLAGEMAAQTHRRSAAEREAAHLETQVALLGRIRDLETERARLVDGQPCPLCGATEHPYAEGNIPALDATDNALQQARQALRESGEHLARLQVQQARNEKDLEQAQREIEAAQQGLEIDRRGCAEVFAASGLPADSAAPRQTAEEALRSVEAKLAQTTHTLSALDDLETQRQALLAAADTAQTALVEAKLAFQQAGHQRETVAREQTRLDQEARVLAARFQEARQQALDEVAPYGLTDLPLTELDGELERLAQRRSRWQAAQARQLEEEKALARLHSEGEKEQALLGKLDEEIRSWGKARGDGTARSEALQTERRELFGDQDPEVEEKRLAAAAAAAETALEAARDACGTAEQTLAGEQTRLAALADSTGQRSQELEQSRQALAQRLAQAGFADEADYRLARLDEAAQEEIAGRAEALRQEQTELETRRADKSAALAAERARQVTSEPRESLQQGLSQCEAALKELQQALGAIGQRLMDNETLRQRQRQRLLQREAQKTECGRWDRLHELIGSADGKKFRNFAQGLTFEIMAAHANRQLQQMSDRYLLVRDAASPLELNVIDNYQAGEIRSTKNLSGGESFIVSLALALGLSHMASQKVRVDSLFLDEGFGTLDEDALETALETLSGLQQKGKLIGVISHVPALKERISTQVQVTPQAGGRSSMAGPGVAAGG